MESILTLGAYLGGATVEDFILRESILTLGAYLGGVTVEDFILRVPFVYSVPDEILCEIVGSADWSSLPNLSATCKKLYHIVNYMKSEIRARTQAMMAGVRDLTFSRIDKSLLFNSDIALECYGLIRRLSCCEWCGRELCWCGSAMLRYST